MYAADPHVKGFYSPELGMIACPLIQAAAGGSRSLPHCFSSDDWLVAPHETLVPMQERLTVWEQLAQMSRAERIQIAEELGIRARINAHMAHERAAAAA